MACEQDSANAETEAVTRRMTSFAAPEDLEVEQVDEDEAPDEAERRRLTARQQTLDSELVTQISTIELEAKQFDEIEHKDWLDADGNQIWSDNRIAVAKVITSFPFECMQSLVILFNMVVMWYETDANGKCYPTYSDNLLACPTHSSSESMRWVVATNLVLLIVYTAELVVFLYAFRRAYFKSTINCIDFAVIVSGWFVEVFGGLVEGWSPAAFRIFRMSRVARGFNKMSSFSEPHKLITGAASIFTTAFFGMLCLVAALWIWSVFLVTIVHAPNTEIWADQGCPRCMRAFSSVYQSMITLFQQIVTGDSWGLVSIPLIESNPWFALLLLPVFCSITFGVLNLTVSVVIDIAAEARENDLDLRQRERQKDLLHSKVKLLQMCQEMDGDLSGSLSLQELREGWMSSNAFRSAMIELNIGLTDIDRVMKILDSDRNGQVKYRQFVDCIYNLRTEDLRMMIAMVQTSLNGIARDTSRTFRKKASQLSSNAAELARHGQLLEDIDSKLELLLRMQALEDGGLLNESAGDVSRSLDGAAGSSPRCPSKPGVYPGSPPRDSVESTAAEELDAKQRKVKADVEKSKAHIREESDRLLHIKERPPWVSLTDKVIWSNDRIVIAKLLQSKAFESLQACIILFNLFCVWYESDMNAQCYPEFANNVALCDTSYSAEPMLWLRAANWVVLSIYTVEAVIGLYAYRRRFLKHHDLTADLVIVVLGWLCEMAQGFFTGFKPAIFRIFRAARFSMHLVAYLSDINEFYIFIKGMASSMRTVFTGTLCLMLMLFFWAVLLVEFGNEYNVEIGKEYEGCTWCKRAFSSVWNAILTLFQQIVTGDSWGLTSIPLIEAKPWLAFLLMPALLSISLGLMNIVLAAIVWESEEARNRDLDHLQAEKRRELLHQKLALLEMCYEMDEDTSGTLSQDEIMHAWDKNASFRSVMVQLGVEAADLKQVMKVLEMGDDFEIPYKDFVDHIYQLRTNDLRMTTALVQLNLNDFTHNVNMLKSKVTQVNRNVATLHHHEFLLEEMEAKFAELVKLVEASEEQDGQPKLVVVPNKLPQMGTCCYS